MHDYDPREMRRRLVEILERTQGRALKSVARRAKPSNDDRSEPPVERFPVRHASGEDQIPW